MKIAFKNTPRTIVFSACLIGLLMIAGLAISQDKFKLKPGAQGKLCLKCHETFQKTLTSISVHPLLKTGKCSECHNPHTSSHKKLLNADITELCLGCHKEVLPEKALSSHQVVKEGKCITCHGSHASDNKFILTKRGNDLCVECHKEIGDNAKAVRFQHEPLTKDKGCLNCHDPHASVKSKFLLRNNVPDLCNGCHDPKKLTFKRRHMQYPVAKSDCGACHNTHGSNKRGILYDEVHAPVAENKCTECHGTPGSPNALKTKKQGIALCRDCHKDMVNQTFSKNRVHWPLVDKTGCLNCHRPHGSKQKKLLQGTVADTCGKCHADTVKLQEWSIKNPKNKGLCEPIKTGNCIACHNPHAADNVLLIAQSDITKDLCGKCHEWQTHSTHPLGEKVIDPRNKNLTVECLSCHQAGGTGNKPAMLPFETTYDLCIQCHPKQKR